MSILKLKIQDFNEIDRPREGWIFLGYDTSGGTALGGLLAQMDEYGNIYYIESGTTAGINGTSGYSGSSATSGSSGTSSTAGTSGLSIIGNTGSGGTAGTSGANGSFLGTNGSSGTGGYTGSSGTSSDGSSGLSGTSGSSGIGTSGSSGSSGTSGVGSSGTSGNTGTNGTSGITDLNSFTWIISDPETGSIPGQKIYNNMNGYDGYSIYSYISGGTNLTFNIQNRFDYDLLVSGTTIFSGTTSQIVLTGDSTTFFRGTSILPDTMPTFYNDSWLWLNITNVTGVPDKLVITLFVTPVPNV